MCEREELRNKYESKTPKTKKTVAETKGKRKGGR
jgi:hypothetical protein